jgi:S1-C subfamily serine protease
MRREFRGARYERLAVADRRRPLRSLVPRVATDRRALHDERSKRRKGEFDEAYGSGVVVASGTWGSQILTAEHVIHDASHLRATLDDSHVVPAHVTAADEKKDLALVQIAVPNRPVATLGASARVEPGTAVGLAGYPIPDAFEDEKLGERVSVYAGRPSSPARAAARSSLPARAP